LANGNLHGRIIERCPVKVKQSRGQKWRLSHKARARSTMGLSRMNKEWAETFA
jgi:hypothetical protein